MIIDGLVSVRCGGLAETCSERLPIYCRYPYMYAISEHHYCHTHVQMARALQIFLNTRTFVSICFYIFSSLYMSQLFLTIVICFYDYFYTQYMNECNCFFLSVWWIVLKTLLFFCFINVVYCKLYCMLMCIVFGMLNVYQLNLSVVIKYMSKASLVSLFIKNCFWNYGF